MKLPAHAETVIIGGGAIGCAVAYHLARRGARDVVLLERRQLTHGATWHAAGLVGQLRSAPGLMELVRRSALLYPTLEAATGQAAGWHGVGSLRVAASPARWAEFRRQAARARGHGLAVEELTPAETLARFPLISLAGVPGSLWIPGDGHVDPASVTQALAKGARAGGVRIVEHVRAEGLRLAGGRVAAVVTAQGEIACERVVNAAGMWGREVGRMAGIDVAVCAVEHQYLVTGPVAGIPRDLPVLRDPDGRFYAKPEVGGLAVGGWEDATPAFGRGGVPREFGPELLAPDFDRFAPIGEAAGARMPAFAEAGVKDMINGPIPITPDGEPVLGPAPGIAGLWLACGFTSGIAAAGGAGQALVDWMLDGDSGLDLSPLDPRRFGALAADEDGVIAAATRAYAGYYAPAAA